MPLKSAMDNMSQASDVHKVSLNISLYAWKLIHMCKMSPCTVIPRCNTGDYRVRNETFIYEDGSTAIYSGLVEVCVDGRYMALCDSGFTMATAELACSFSSYGPPFYREFIQSMLRPSSQYDTRVCVSSHCLYIDIHCNTILELSKAHTLHALQPLQYM